MFCVIFVSKWWCIGNYNHVIGKVTKNHVITLYSVVTWFFFCKFCLIFREFKADLTVT